MSSEELTEFYTEEKSFQRLKDSGIEKNSFNIGTVFVDPPRAGLDQGTCNLISRFNKIVYVSCNPETLARDVKQLLLTHTVTHVAAFDQFPYTHHLESGVVMIKKNDDCNVVEVAKNEDTESKVKKPRLDSNED